MVLSHDTHSALTKQKNHTIQMTHTCTLWIYKWQSTCSPLAARMTGYNTYLNFNIPSSSRCDTCCLSQRQSKSEGKTVSVHTVTAYTRYGDAHLIRAQCFMHAVHVDRTYEPYIKPERCAVMIMLTLKTINYVNLFMWKEWYIAISYDTVYKYTKVAYLRSKV